MAVLDPRNDAVVIRVVYDGAPMSGKSTSVAALGKGLGAEVYSPAEVGGRTLYFDWLDYTGGLFEGRRIRCQIISVPGQATLAPRRRRLLESADVVVFVGDSTPAGFDADRGYLGGLYRVLAQLSGPPVGVVLQANKRDHAQAVPIPQVRSMLEEMGMRIGVVESVAIDGAGVREAFVFAVRLALDRVRELMRTGKLRSAAPEIDSARDLLDELKRSEDGAMDYAAANGLTHTRLSDVRPQSIAAEAFAQAVRDNTPPPAARGGQTETGDDYEPAPPNEHVASGMVWPPVDGRTVLHELGQAQIRLTRSPGGDWTGSANGRWQIHSAADAVYEELEQGRSVLVRSARVHASSSRERSLDRCVVLAGDGRGKYRLWQITRIH
jgi:hypothetical protein